MDTYSKSGKAITLDEFVALMENPDNRIIQQDNLTLPPSIAIALLSTVWLGVEHGTDSNGKPLIFETMFFDKEEQCKRYATEGEARRGHIRMLEDLKAKGWTIAKK